MCTVDYSEDQAEWTVKIKHDKQAFLSTIEWCKKQMDMFNPSINEFINYSNRVIKQEGLRIKASDLLEEFIKFDGKDVNSIQFGHMMTKFMNNPSDNNCNIFRSHTKHGVIYNNIGLTANKSYSTIPEYIIQDIHNNKIVTPLILNILPSSK